MDDARLLALLAAAIARGEVDMDLDRGLATHVHSPVASEAEGNLLLLVTGAPVATLWWWQGHLAGLAGAALAAVALSLFYGRILAWRMRKRVLRQALSEIDLWRRLWRFGGVTLRRPEDGGAKDTPDVCAAPDQSWQRFARKLGEGETRYSAG
ncbi:MAG: hypothetical protein KIT81_13185 [Alphaproteobacteria bacterium]|nr:hypothetical protein [Alphaproteobacteria bacterium]